MILDHLPSLLAAAANVHAIATAIWARRTPPAPVLRRLANRCWISLLALNALLALLFIQALRADFAATDPGERATRLAYIISAVMNCTAFAVMGSILPFVVGIWLARKARRAP